jgi:penicillin-binding protein 1A
MAARLALLRERMRPNPDDPARAWMRRHRWPLLGLLVMLLGVGAADTWLVTCGFRGCPSAAEIRAFRPPEGGRVLDRDGRMMGRVVPVRRLNVSLALVPAHVRAAFIATEDRRFYDHNGLDWRGLFRAVGRNARAMRVREGFSTITMQAARNTFAVERLGERSMARKLIELRLSRLMERNLTKDQILELYLNAIYLGNGVYGVEAASRDLFGKSVKDVNLSEAALLAALPKGPSAYTPRRSPERALRRRNLVLQLMVREGFITPHRAESATGQRLVLAKSEWRPDRANDSYALDAVRAFVDSIREAYHVQSSDITVYTTLDISAQRAAAASVAKHAAQIERGSGRRSAVGDDDALQGAMVAIDPRTGDVRALVGGRWYEKGNFNRATGARRQPGSAFKPFVYAAALASGMTPATLVDDDPVEVELDGRVWTPANFNNDYGGRMTIRRALMRSANAATVRVSREVGEARVVQVAHANGIDSPLQAVPSIALGALEVTPLELATAYAPFANGGSKVKPRLVRRVETADGVVVWESAVQRSPAMDARDAFQLTSMLRSVVDAGTGRALRDYGVTGPVAGKTGTTNNGSDVWFVGYTPNLVAAIWFGYDSPHSIGYDASGGRLAAPAWAEFYLNGWHERARDTDWQPPPGLVDRTIDATNGLLAGEYCPLTQREWFKVGTEPTRYCDEHLEPVYEPPIPDTIQDMRPWIDGVGRKLGKALKKVFKF